MSHIASAALKLTVLQGYPRTNLPDPIFQVLLGLKRNPTPGREDAVVPSLVYSFSVSKASVGDFCFSAYRLSLSEEKTVWEMDGGDRCVACKHANAVNCVLK